LQPYEIVLRPGETVKYSLVGFDENGRVVKEMATTLTVGEGLAGLQVAGNSVSAPINLDAHLAGTVSAAEGGITAAARIRYLSAASKWKWDFSGYKGPQVPSTWLRAFAKIKPTEVEGDTAMMFAGIGTGKGRPSHTIWIGTPDMKDYSVQADVMLKEDRRQLPDIGVNANRYDFMLKGNTGKIRISSWAPHLRMAKEQSFASQPDVWYTMKIKVDANDREAKVFGKIWERGQPEPEQWTIEAADPHPNLTGSPGISVYATADCLFDNVIVSFERRGD
jgi:hypothetical protein